MGGREAPGLGGSLRRGGGRSPRAGMGREGNLGGRAAIVPPLNMLVPHPVSFWMGEPAGRGVALATGQGRREAWGRWGPGRRGVVQAWPLGVKDADSWRGLGGVSLPWTETVCVFVGVPGCLCMSMCTDCMCVHLHRPSIAVSVRSWVMCVCLRGPTPVPTAVRGDAYGCPQLAQTGPSWRPSRSPGRHLTRTSATFAHKEGSPGALIRARRAQPFPSVYTRPREGQGLPQVTQWWRQSRDCTQVWGSQAGTGAVPGLTIRILPLVPFGCKAPWRGQEAGPAPALLCAPGRSWLALLGPQLPPLCEGYLWEWTLVPVVAGRALLPTVTNLSQFAEDFPGLSTASPVS